MRRDQAISTIRDHRAELLDYSVSSIAVFGSIARDTAGPASDVDILVEFKGPVGLFTLATTSARSMASRTTGEPVRSHESLRRRC
jgi:predicted nucleotidyltransferase